MSALLPAWIAVQLATTALSVLLLRRREGRFGSQQLLRTIMIVALATGTTTHVALVWRWGLIADTSQPPAFNYYWAALTLLDPLAALFLLLAPRAGLILTIAIMISDVSINFFAARLDGGGFPWSFWWQSGFALFVLAAAPWCWKQPQVASRRMRAISSASDGTMGTP